MNRKQSDVQNSVSPMRATVYDKSPMRKNSQYQDGRQSHVYVSPTYVSSNCFYPHISPHKQDHQEVQRIDAVKMRDKYQTIFNNTQSRHNYYPENQKDRKQTPIKSQNTVNNVNHVTPLKLSENLNTSMIQTYELAASIQSQKRAISSNNRLRDQQQVPRQQIDSKSNKSYVSGVRNDQKFSSISVSNKSDLSKSNVEIRRFSDYKNYANKQNQTNNLSNSCVNVKNDVPKIQINVEEIKVCINCFNDTLVDQKHQQQKQEKQGDKSFNQNLNKITKFLEDTEKIEYQKQKQYEKDYLMSEYQRVQESKKDKKSNIQREKEEFSKKLAQDLKQENEINEAIREENLKMREQFNSDLKIQVHQKQQQHKKDKLKESTSFSIGQEYDMVSQTRSIMASNKQDILSNNQQQKLQKEAEERNKKAKDKDLERRVQQELQEQDNQQQNVSLIQKRVQQESMQRYMKLKLKENTEQKILEKQKEEEYYKLIKIKDDQLLARQNQEKQLEKIRQQSLVKDLSTQIQMKRENQKHKKDLEKSQDQKLSNLSQSFDFLTKPLQKGHTSQCDCCKNQFMLDHLTKVKKC